MTTPSGPYQPQPGHSGAPQQPGYGQQPPQPPPGYGQQPPQHQPGYGQQPPQQQPYGQQPYGQQPYGHPNLPSTPPKKNKLVLPLLLGGIGLVLIIALVATLVTVTRSTPSKTVREFLAAVKVADCAKARSLVTETVKGDFECSSSKPIDLEVVNVSSRKPIGTTTSVVALVRLEGKTGTLRFSLLKQSGKWKISGVTADF